MAAPPIDQHSSEQVGKRPALKRRGILAAAGAVISGVIAKTAVLPVRATTTDTNFVATGGVGSSGVGFGTGGGPGFVVGVGVSGSNFGVSGFGGKVGVSGGSTADSGIGVQGQATGGVGVYGAGTTGVGVYGYSSGTAVYAYSTAGTSLYGVTNASNQYGVLGTTTAPNSTAVAGIANQVGCSAFSGGTTNAAAYAGVFQGTVVVQGRLIVSDPSYKSGALAHPDGSHRLVYCVESPESWIEDVGKGTLAGGKATVTFDKDFAAVTHTDDYRAFLTPEGDCNGLYVTDKTAAGFTVRELHNGTSALAFSWRVMVMVKGKSEVKRERLAKFTMPNISLPDPAKFKAPEMPNKP